MKKVNLAEKLALINEYLSHGVEHHPIADEEVEVLLFEPKNVKNTGNTED